MWQEFLEFSFAKACIPTKMEVFETFTPGAMVKISAKGPSGTWITLWSGEQDKGAAAAGTSRIFAPTLATLEFPASQFRVDIDCVGWTGWYEIDAIRLTGTVMTSAALPFDRPAPGTLAGDLLALLQSGTGDVCFRAATGEEVARTAALPPPDSPQLRAHSAVVLARCPALLKAHTQPIRVPDHGAALRLVLQWIYCDAADIPGRLAIAVHVSAVRYALPALAHLALTRFASGLADSNVFAALKLVDGIADLRKTCLQFVAKHPSLMQPAAMDALSHAQLAELVTILALGVAGSA